MQVVHGTTHPLCNKYIWLCTLYRHASLEDHIIQVHIKWFLIKRTKKAENLPQGGADFKGVKMNRNSSRWKPVMIARTLL